MSRVWAHTTENIRYRDLNKNGRMDPYEDPRLTPEERADDLLQRLSPDEKIGLMFQSIAEIDPGGAIVDSVGDMARVKVLTATFGCSDDAYLRALTAHVAPEGRLPFEIPRSMDAVRNSREDVPNDTTNPLFPAGFGLELRAHTGQPV